MKLALSLMVLFAATAEAQVDTSIYNNLGNRGPMQAYQMRTRPVGQMNIQTINSGNTSYTTGSDGNGNNVNCRTIRAGNLVQTFCN